jgi:hypothetical protein
MVPVISRRTRSTNLCLVVDLVYTRVGKSVVCVGSVGVYSCMYKILLQLYGLKKRKVNIIVLTRVTVDVEGCEGVCHC